MKRLTFGAAKTPAEDRLSEAGQVLPLVALFIVVLFGFAALAIDVSRAYADLRFYRAAADAASLAGAQDLQVPGTRTVNAADYTRARQHALESLEDQLGGSGSACGPTSSDIVDCALLPSPYVVAIKTNPSPTCSDCDPFRAVQVTVAHPNYGLTFARVLGSDHWDPGVTSVSGMVFGKAYTVITLRPPKKTGSTFDVKDITIDGGSIVNVINGDVGSNANMNYSGTDSIPESHVGLFDVLLPGSGARPCPTMGYRPGWISARCLDHGSQLPVSSDARQLGFEPMLERPRKLRTQLCRCKRSIVRNSWREPGMLSGRPGSVVSRRGDNEGGRCLLIHDGATPGPGHDLLLQPRRLCDHQPQEVDGRYRQPGDPQAGCLLLQERS